MYNSSLITVLTDSRHLVEIWPVINCVRNEGYYVDGCEGKRRIISKDRLPHKIGLSTAGGPKG